MQMKSAIPVGIFAASSVVPQVEFRAGVEHLRNNGFDPRIQPQVSAEHFIFAGSDEQRARAFYDLASDPTIPILWAARGGYGATRLIPQLDHLTRKGGRPQAKKLLVGYSDVTVLHEFVRQRWGWSTLHAPMPAASNFGSLDPAEWNAIAAFVRGESTPDVPWQHTTLRWITDPPATPVRAELVGGNLSLWAAMAGTPLAVPGRGKILFLEDVDEAVYRIDRMMTQLSQSGAIDGAAAIVLGDFTRCNDENNQCLAAPGRTDKKPLRKVYEQPEAFKQIFGQFGVPVAFDLPVGHGSRYAPLPLGATYELTPGGKLRLLEWSWSARGTHA
jgi:muramoyltetrapeptide carboxypeptidase